MAVMGAIAWLAVLDTFVIVRLKDDERLGEYRTKRLILERY